MSNANFNPDSLLKDINKSILTKGIIIALVAHAIIIFGTSFSLYRDWQDHPHRFAGNRPPLVSARHLHNGFAHHGGRTQR